MHGMQPAEGSRWAAALDAPWKAGSELRRHLALPFIRAHFALHGVRWGRRWRIFGAPLIQRYRRSRIDIGDQVEMRSWPSSNPLVPYHRMVLATRGPDARIIIGDGSRFTGTTIVAATEIRFGQRVTVGSNVTIVDTDFHPLHADARAEAFNDGRSAAVSIGDDVFIGMNCLILKGVRIGEGSVIGAGSVVTRDVDAGAIVAGNPAVVVGRVG